MMWRIVKNGHPGEYWDGWRWGPKSKARWYCDFDYLVPMFGRWEGVPDPQTPQLQSIVEWSEGALVSPPKE